MSRLWVIFDAICFLLAVYMTLIIVRRFLEDRSKRSIDYKKYAEIPEDQYPAFSICLKEDGLYRYNDVAIYKAYGIYRAEYQMMLQGNRAFKYVYNATSKSYTKELIPLEYTPNVTYEDLVENIDELSKIVKATHFECKGKGRKFLCRNDSTSTIFMF